MSKEYTYEFKLLFHVIYQCNIHTFFLFNAPSKVQICAFRALSKVQM